MTQAAKKDITRRTALELFGTMGALFAVGCGTSALAGSDADAGTSASGTGADGAAGTDAGAAATGEASSAACVDTPGETAGPYPDKTGMISNQQFFRKDITEGKTGLPLALAFTVVDVKTGCTPIANAVVEVWHCDKDGVYSEYTGQPGVSADESTTTFLRGLQATDANGQAGFTTIYPGWYGGRVTHVHINVYLNGSTTPALTTQMAFPDPVNTAVYGTAAYAKGQNTLVDATDMVFSDGDTYELGTLVGDPNTAYTATLQLALNV